MYGSLSSISRNGLGSKVTPESNSGSVFGKMPNNFTSFAKEQARNLSESAKIAFDSSEISQTIGNIQTMSTAQLRQLLSFLESQITKVKKQINNKDNIVPMDDKIENMAETIRNQRAAAAVRGGKKRIGNKKRSKKMRGGYTYKPLSKNISNASLEITGSTSSNSLSSK